MSQHPVSRAVERPATEAQVQANQANAQRSTGPTSVEGKATVSQNRRVHGLNYNAATFTVLPCEDQSDYDRLLHDLQETHQPQTTTESLLVVSMAQHRWLLDRANRLQETCFDPQTGQIADTKLFALYLRYATTHERAFHKCHNDLLNHRIQEQKRQIGFESEKRRADLHPLKVSLQILEYTHRERIEHGEGWGKILRERAEEELERMKNAA